MHRLTKYAAALLAFGLFSPDLRAQTPASPTFLDLHVGGTLSLTGTGATHLNQGTTAQRPDTGSAGSVRYNSDTGRYEFGIGSSWSNHVRLDGDTMIGTLTIGGATAKLIYGNGNNFAFGGGAASHANAPMQLQSLLTGTVASGSQGYFDIWIPSDGVTAPTANGELAGVLITHTLAAAAAGNRWTVDIGTANSAALSSAAAIGAIRAQATAQFTMGGTNTTFAGSQGFVWGFNFTGAARGAATNLHSVVGGEVDVGLLGTSTAFTKEGAKIVLLSGDQARGAVHDYGLGIGAQEGQPTEVGWSYGLVFGGEGGFGMSSTGTMIGSYVGTGTFNTGFGVDFLATRFATAAIRTPGFVVDGSGNLAVGPGKLTFTNANLQISAPNAYEVSAVVHSGGGGTGYVASERVEDATNGIWTVTQSAGVVTSVALERTGYATSCPAAGAATVSTRGLTGGSGLTLDITCSAVGGNVIIGSNSSNVQIDPTGAVVMSGIPTSAPGTHCALWVNSGVVTRTTCP